MTAAELISYLSNPHCPKDATVRVVDERTEEDKQKEFLAPEVVWWSDDRKTVYLGLL